MNNVKYNILILFLFLIVSSIDAKSDDPIVAKVGDEIIFKSELEYAYNKSQDEKTSKKQTKEQFLQSYIDLKLKVQEAKNLHLDEDTSFNSEYNAYLQELKNPYMQDTITIQDYAKMLYRRLHENVEVSQLFIAFPSGVILPKDTLESYEKIVKIKQELKSNGNNFEDMVKKYSNDTITATSPRPGYIGWITALMTDPVIENAVYNTPVNDISEPIRTNYGYVLTKTLNKRPDEGQMLVSHIMLQYPQADPSQIQKDSLRDLANNIYERLLAGENFKELCTQYSMDEATVKDDGRIDWFGTKNPLPPAFEAELKKIKVGEFTKPQETFYGYHIFRLDEEKNIAPFDDAKKNLIEYLKESNRIDIINFEELEKLKKEVPFQINKSSYQKLENIAQLYMPNDTLFLEEASELASDILLQIDKREYTTKDFLFFLAKNPYYRVRLSTDILNYALDYFTLSLVKEAKNETLLENYPELQNVAREYCDGILLFNVTNKEIWEKAQANNQEIENLYNTNPQKHKWDSSKYEGYLIFAKDKEIEQQAKQIIDMHKKSNNLISILKEELNKEGQINVVIEKGFWGKGDNEYVDRILYNTPTKKQMIGYPEYFLEGNLIETPRNLEDVRGLVTSEYQAILEKEWVESLREKYKVEIDKNALN